MFVHRALPDADIYFIDNHSERDKSGFANFRIAGRTPELWDPTTGSTEPISYNIVDNHTNAPLHLDPWESVFIVFRRPTNDASLVVGKSPEAPLNALDDALNHNWIVNFEAGRGAPDSTSFEKLISWSDHADAGIKYFSGTATYTKNFQLPASALASGAHLSLDLGNVREIAELAINGKYLGILWKPPYKLDITSALKPGQNQIVIQVTNLWVNRLIGDQQPWAIKKYAFTDFAPYKGDSPLLPSGLLGPVKILSTSAP
jgi:hypothetical protein